MTDNAAPRRGWMPKPRYVLLICGLVLAAGFLLVPGLSRSKTITLDDPPVWDFTWSPDGAAFAYCGNLSCHVLNARTGAKILDLPDDLPGQMLRFSPDGKTLIMAAPTDAPGVVLSLWDARTGASRGLVRWPHDPHFQFGKRIMALAANGSLLAVTQLQDASQPVQFYTMPDFKPGRSFMPPGETGLEALALSPDGKYLAMAADKGRIFLVPVDGDAPPRIFHYDIPAKTMALLTQLAFSPDGSAIVAGFNSILANASGWPRPPLLLWSLAGGDDPRPLCGIQAVGTSQMIWRPDSRSVAMTNGFDAAKICPVDGGAARSLAVPDGWAVPAFSPDGKRLAVATGADIFIFNLSP